MAELAIASGIAGIITLSSAVVATGYKYVSSVATAPEDLKDLIREIASMNTLLTKLVSVSLSPGWVPRDAFDALAREGVIEDCENTLRSVHSILRNSEPGKGKIMKNLCKSLLWPAKRKDIIKHRDRVSRLCTLLHEAIAIDNTSTLERIEFRQEENIIIATDVKRDIAQIEELKVFEWLSLLNPALKHTATSSLLQPGTSNWFLTHKAFLDWRNCGDMLWLKGHAGTGKMVLVSSSIDHVARENLAHSTSTAIAYHYCEFSQPATLDPAKILGSIVRQIVDQADYIPSIVQDSYHALSGGPPSMQTLVQLLEQLANQEFKTIYIFIDGLDECPTRQSLLKSLNEVLRALRKKGTFRILLSSRPEYDLEQALANEPCFSILRRHVEPSLEAHARIEIKGIVRLRHLSDSDRKALVAELVDRADGMFRWIQCQLDALRSIRTRQGLEDALKSLPVGLYETYDRIFEGIRDQDEVYVSRMLKWLVAAERPLYLDDLAEAIAINPNKDHIDDSERLMEPNDVLDLCGSLIRLESDDQIILAHFSVKEYLLSNRLTGQAQRLSRFALEESSSRRHVLMCILTYVSSIGVHIQNLVQKRFNETEFPLCSNAKNVPIQRFCEFDAMRPWVEKHFPRNKANSSKIESLIDYLGRPAPCEDNYLDSWFVQKVLQCALMCYWNGSIQHGGPPTESLGAVERLNGIVDMFLRMQRSWDDPKNVSDILIDCDCRVSPSPLCTAAARGFDHAARYLLENGAMVDGMPPPYRVGVPLLRALAYGQERVFEVLIEFNADVNVRSPGTCPSTALEMAGGAYFAVPELTAKLMQNEALDVDVVGSRGQDIRYWAKYDQQINRGLQPFASILKQKDDTNGSCNYAILYSDILETLRSMKDRSTVRHHFGLAVLSISLFHCGPKYYDYAAIIAEQSLVPTSPVTHQCHCDLCVHTMGGYIRGRRFFCLQCMDVVLCDDCYGIWKHSNGEMDFCRGHTFFEIPRPCWYGLREGTVTEDGKTLGEVIEWLEAEFTRLLDHERAKV